MRREVSGTESTNTAGNPLYSPGDAVLLLTNYPGSGIGDFGLDLALALKRLRPGLRVESTRPDGRGIVRQASRIILAEGLVIANVGLTSWGPEGPRNLLGFLSLGIRGALGRPTVVLLHHAIEFIEVEESGYSVGPGRRWGAHFAVALLRRCRLVVFVPRMRELLEREYSIHPVWTTPLPCEESSGRTTDEWAGPERPHVVSVGYLAPYKGLELLVEVADRMKAEARMIVIGGVHPILRHKTKFQEQLTRFREGISASGGLITGYLPSERLRIELSKASVGLLAHTSMSGGSASFSTLASAGVPVVATDLPEFRFLRSAGAAIELAAPTTESFVATLRRVLSDQVLRSEMRDRQRQFASTFNWSRFAARILAIGRGEGADPIAVDLSYSRRTVGPTTPI